MICVEVILFSTIVPSEVHHPIKNRHLVSHNSTESYKKPLVLPVDSGHGSCVQMARCVRYTVYDGALYNILQNVMEHTVPRRRRGTVRYVLHYYIDEPRYLILDSEDLVLGPALVSISHNTFVVYKILNMSLKCLDTTVINKLYNIIGRRFAL